jgi:hypothetical protein
MTTAYILVRHLDSRHGVERFEIGGGQFVRIAQNAVGRGLIDRCRQLFPAAYAQYSDWVYEKNYPVTPPARVGSDPSGFGDIPYEVEDLLLGLRLTQPGDISFVAQTVVGEDLSSWFQQPYRYFGSIASTHPYRFDPDLIPKGSATAATCEAAGSGLRLVLGGETILPLWRCEGVQSVYW